MIKRFHLLVILSCITANLSSLATFDFLSKSRTTKHHLNYLSDTKVSHHLDESKSKIKSNDINKVSVFSFNIRYDNPKDYLFQWTYRRELLANIILRNSPDIYGGQEIKPNQLEYLKSALAQTYSYTGIPRDPAGIDESCGIFFRKDKYAKMNEESFWLSEDTSGPGHPCWDCAMGRNCNAVHLRPLENVPSGNRDSDFVAISCHYDHKGEYARFKSAEICLSKIDEYKQNWKVNNAILFGDLNNQAQREKFVDFLEDSLDNASKGNNQNTFHGFFGGEGTHLNDYIFHTRTGVSSNFEIVRDNMNGFYPSDHYAIKADIEFNY